MHAALRIAVADDSLDILEILCRILSRLGHDAIKASTGIQLVENCRNEHIDLVLTDILMPGLNGIEAVERIPTQIPVVFLTGNYETEFVRQIERVGGYQLILKPVNDKAIESAISLAMFHKDTEDALKSKIKDLEAALENRVIIEKAKGILMQVFSLSEPDAMCALQKKARDSRTKLIDIAHKVLIDRTIAKKSFQSIVPPSKRKSVT